MVEAFTPDFSSGARRVQQLKARGWIQRQLLVTGKDPSEGSKDPDEHGVGWPWERSLGPILPPHQPTACLLPNCSLNLSFFIHIMGEKTSPIRGGSCEKRKRASHSNLFPHCPDEEINQPGRCTCRKGPAHLRKEKNDQTSL